jgi:hypothetical protein
MTGAFAIAFAAACNSDDEHGPDAGCQEAYLGDKSAPMQLDIIALGPDSGTSMGVDEGSTLSLDFPPQGGRVVFIGARATNLDPCGVKMIGTVRDPSSGQIRTDQRTVNMEPGAVPGFGGSVDSNIFTFANVPICPNQWATSDAFGVPFEWTLQITDRTGKVGQKTFHAKMACLEPDHLAECLCTCRKGYVLGEHCDPDASPVSDEDAAVDAPAVVPTDAATDSIGTKFGLSPDASDASSD